MWASSSKQEDKWETAQKPTLVFKSQIL